MACQILTTRGAVFVLWGRPTAADMDDVQQAVEAAAASCGRPVVYVTRVPADAPPPCASARARLDELMPSFVKACSTYHVVLEGEGFGAAMKRAILTGLFQLTWRRKTFFVHADAKEVAPSLPEECRVAVAHLLATAERRGLLSATSPTSA